MSAMGHTAYPAQQPVYKTKLQSCSFPTRGEITGQGGLSWQAGPPLRD